MAEKTKTPEERAAEAAQTLTGLGLDTSQFQVGGAQTSPLGVPSGFVADRPANPFTDPSGSRIAVEPTFVEGDENLILNLPYEVRQTLVKKMEQAGVYDAARVKPNTPGDIDAYRTLLSFANAVGATNDEDALKHWRRLYPKGTDFGGELDAPTLPAPEDMRRSIRQATIQELGRRLDPAEEDAMVDAYSNVYQSRAQGSVAPPSTEVFVEQQIESGPFATESEAFDFAQRAQNFYSTLAGPQGPGVSGTTL